MHAPKGVVVFFGRIGGLSVSLLLISVVPGVLGAESYGYFAFLFSQLFLLVMVLDLGATEMLRRYLPLRLRQGRGADRSLVAQTGKLKVLAALPLAPLAWFATEPIDYLWIYLAALAATFSWLCSDVHFAAGRMGTYSLYNPSRKGLRLVLLLLFFAWLGHAGILGALVATEFVVLAAYLWSIRGMLSTGSATDSGDRDRLRFGLALFAATLLFMATGRLPVLLSGWNDVSYAEIARLALALDIAYFAMREVFYAFGESVHPDQALAWSAGDRGRVVELHLRALVLPLALMLPGLSVLAVFGERMLGIIGPEFAGTAEYLLVLLPAAVFNVAGYLYRQLVGIAERKWWVLASYLAGFVVFLLTAAAGGMTPMSMVWGVTAGSGVALGLLRWAAGVLFDLSGERPIYLKVSAVAGAFHIAVAYASGLQWHHAALAVTALGLAYAGAIRGLGLLQAPRVPVHPNPKST